MQLIVEVRDAMRRGDDPSGDVVRGLANRWAQLIHEFTDGDAQLAAGVRRAYEAEQTIHGLDTAEIRAMCAFLGRPSLVSR